MENFVEEQDTQQSGFDEAQAAGQDTLSGALAEISQAAAEPEQSQPETEEAPSQPEQDSDVPKALRGRIKTSERRGYERGKQEIEDKYRADIEELNKFRLERDVKELAAQEKISESLARRLLMAERGMPRTESAHDETPRNDAPAQKSVQDRAQELYAQAQTIEAATGLNVLEIFENDQEAHRKVVSGEWDFTDIAKSYSFGQRAARAPSPARSANRANGISGRDIRNMSDEEFARLDSMLDYRSIDTRR